MTDDQAMKDAANKRFEESMKKRAEVFGKKIKGHVRVLGDESPVVTAFNEVMRKQRRRKLM